MPKGPVDQQYTHIPVHLHSVVVYVCLTIVLLSAAAATAYLFFLAQGGVVYQYRFALALLCFALSTVSCLMLYGRVHFSGKWGHNTLVLAGPASMWLVSLIVFSHIFPDNSSIITVTPPPKGEMIYEAWLKQLHTVAPVFRRSEDKNVSSLLSNVYFPGYEHIKPTQVRINDVLMYFPNGQAIEVGNTTGRNDSGKAEIYQNLRSSFLTSSLFARAYTAHSHKFQAVPDLEGKEWHPSADADINWFDVIVYLEKVEDADFVILDTPKYIDNAKQDGADVTFTLASSRPLRNIRAWEVIPAQIAQGGAVPLLFKQWNEAPDQGLGASRDGIAPFIQWLDLQRTSTQRRTRAFLQS